MFTNEEQIAAMVAINSSYSSSIEELNSKSIGTFRAIQHEMLVAMQNGDKEKAIELLQAQMAAAYSFSNEYMELANKCAGQLSEIMGA